MNEVLRQIHLAPIYPMAGFCEQNDKHSDSTKWWNFLTNRIINCPNTLYHGTSLVVSYETAKLGCEAI
jgi:hypothetical protein